MDFTKFENTKSTESSKRKAQKAIRKLILKNKKHCIKFQKYSIKWFSAILTNWFIETKRKSLKSQKVECIRCISIIGKSKDLIWYVKTIKNHNVTPKTEFEFKEWTRKLIRYVIDEDLHKPPQQAKILTYKRGTKIIKKLWNTDPTNRSKYQRKKAALMVSICLLTGARFGDLVHLKWKNVVYQKTNNGTEFIKLILSFSKGDPLNNRGDVKMFRVDKNNEFNPWGMLKFFARRTKRSEKYVFATEVFKHSRKLRKEFYSTSDMVYHLQRGAKQCAYKTIYTGHSCRNGVVSTLTMGGATDEQLRIFLNWQPDSTMPHLYKRTNCEQSNIGCAKLMNGLIESKEIFSLQNNLMF